MRRAAIAAIRAYQRHLSPRKGYGCAYRLVHGGSGCSGVGLRVIRRYGLAAGLLLLRERTRRCSAAHHQARAHRRLAAPHQRGDCDIGCLDCLPCDAACDLPLSKRQEQWLNENWPLLLFGTAVITATAYILYTALF